jgi:aspartate carbamoyltransferase catalytic subunit
MSQARQEFQWTRRHLLGLEELSKEEILHILDLAQGFKQISSRSIKKAPALRGKVVVLLFFEPSTRTSMSFSLAAQRLSADVLEFHSESSSIRKGETLVDTARNIEAMGVDIFILRHPATGAPQLLSRSVNASVVNAGDGEHEHPTQGLLDLYTMREAKGRIEGLKVAIVGDIAHSRVARSNLFALTKLGAEVTFVGPPTQLPAGLAECGAKMAWDLDAVLPEMDVVNLLRIQAERQGKNSFPTIREYSRLFGMNAERLARCKKDVLVMHPGPINRGVEITSEVADGPNSAILQQVTNGVAIRMAVMYLVAGARGKEGKQETDR